MPKGDRLRLKADPEDGTTPIANLLLDAVAMAKLSGLEKGAILHLWRVTYGWMDGDGTRRKEAKVSLGEWAKALDSTNPRVSVTLAELVKKHVVLRRTTDDWGGYYYRFNTDISAWNSGSVKESLLREVAGIPDFSSIIQKQTVTENETITNNGNNIGLGNSYRKRNGTVTENETEQLPKTKLPTLYKEILNKDKESNTRDVTKSFALFWERYPRKVAKAAAQKAFRKLNPTDELMISIMDGIKRAMLTENWLKDSGKYIPYPATYLNGRRWEDEFIEVPGNNGTHQSNGQASGQSAGDSPETSKYISGKYGHLVQH